MTEEIDAETAKKLDKDAIEADEIISDEIPDEFLAFLHRHFATANAACVQVDYGRGWQTLKQRVRFSRTPAGEPLASVDDIAGRVLGHVTKHAESDRPAKHYRVRLQIVDPNSGAASRFHTLKVGLGADGEPVVHDSDAEKGPGADYWRVLTETFESFGRQAIKAHSAVADQAKNFATYSEQMVKMSEANIAMAERVVTHAVEVEKVKLEDRDRQREHESDMHRTDKLGDFAAQVAPIIVQNMTANAAKAQAEKNEKEKGPEQMSTSANTTGPCDRARELTGWLGSLDAKQRASFWQAFDDDARALIENATRAQSNDEVKALVERLREHLQEHDLLGALQTTLVGSLGAAHALSLQTWLEHAVK
jgi:hypothetical protein